MLERAFEPAFAVRSRPRTCGVTLNVSVLPSVAERWLAPRLPRFAAAHPHIAIALHPDVALAPLRKRDRIDVALRYSPARGRASSPRS